MEDLSYYYMDLEKISNDLIKVCQSREAPVESTQVDSVENNLPEEVWELANRLKLVSKKLNDQYYQNRDAAELKTQKENAIVGHIKFKTPTKSTTRIDPSTILVEIESVSNLEGSPIPSDMWPVLPKPTPVLVTPSWWDGVRRYFISRFVPRG